MSDIEVIVKRWLDNRGVEYSFQTQLAGGFFQLGGAVVDFIIHQGRLAWRVQGEYFHRGVVKEGSDLYQRTILESMGYTVVDIWGDDIKDNTDATLELALQGQEVLR